VRYAFGGYMLGQWWIWMGYLYKFTTVLWIDGKRERERESERETATETEEQRETEREKDIEG